VQVGWEHSKVAAAHTEAAREVKLILKKQPRHVTTVGFEKRKPTTPRKELPKFSVGPKVRRSHGQRSRKTGLNSSLNSSLDNDLVSHASVDRYQASSLADIAYFYCVFLCSLYFHLESYQSINQ